MFTESLALAPAFIGLLVYGTLGMMGTLWLVTRIKPSPGVQKSGSRQQ